MTGNELVKAIKNSRGKIFVGMATPFDVCWVIAEKSYLVSWASTFGEEDTKMVLTTDNEGFNYIEIERGDN